MILQYNKQPQQTSICVIAGGEQAYLTKMYCPLVGFLFVWTNTLILNPGGLAAISLYCAEYIVVNIQKLVLFVFVICTTIKVM